MDHFSDLSFSMTLTGIQGSERLYVKAWETGLLVKKKSSEIQHSYPEGSNDAQLFYCLVQVRHFREYILSFNEPTAEGPGFISAARILSLFQVPIIFLYSHLSLFLGCVYSKCLSLSLQCLSSFYRCLCSPQEFLNLPSTLPLTTKGKPCRILVFLCIPGEERETFPSKINILPWQVGARLGPLCGVSGSRVPYTYTQACTQLKGKAVPHNTQLFQGLISAVVF